MKKNVLKKGIIIVILVTFLCMPIVNLAHSGRTDSSGGHRDNKNASGLGSYHYHCGGHPAHLHTGGVCPYSSPSAPAAASTTSSSTTSSSTQKTTTPQKITATKVEVDVEDVELLIGESKKITVTVSPSNAEDKSVTWKSSNKEVAMVDSEGEVLGLGIGETIVTVTTANGKKASVNVTVNPIKVTEIKVNETDVNLEINETVTLTATVLPTEATDKTITWSSENPEIATVEDGEVKAIAAGTTKIICSSKDEIKTEVNVVVEEKIEENIIEENTVEVVATVDNNSSNSNTSDGDAVAGLITMGALVGGPVYAYKKIKNRKNKKD